MTTIKEGNKPHREEKQKKSMVKGREGAWKQLPEEEREDRKTLGD